MPQQNAASLPWREDRYDGVFRHFGSPLLSQIWRSSFGDDYPGEAEPFGFVTRPDLDKIVRHCALSPDGTLLDMGCGRGGPGLWVAQDTKAALTGIDISEGAILGARQLQQKFRLASEPAFLVGRLERTGLPSSSFDSVMSVDALWMVLDKVAAIREAARVMKPGARFAFTTWAPAYLNLKQLLADAGLTVVLYDETADWLERQLSVYSQIARQRDALAAEMGAEAAEVLVEEATSAPKHLPQAPRMFVLAEK